MQIGMVGLGRMGANMGRRLARGGIEVAAFDVSPVARSAFERSARGSVHADLDDLLRALRTPRVLWMMLPAGEISERMLDELAFRATAGDVIVDGGNARYQDSIRRHRLLEARDIQLVDAGVSGGIWGLENGYCIMLGGRREAVARIEPFVTKLAPAPNAGWLHCGPPGAGHFAKMIHNGIEYGMMQAYAEGLAMLNAKEEFQFDLAALTECWRHGSVVRSWLLDLVARFLEADQSLSGIKPVVADSGEGRWAAMEAVQLGVPAPVITLALMARFASQGHDDYAARLLAMMRAGFGGHAVEHSETP